MKQSTRLIKAYCDECGYTVRVTRKWIRVAFPICPLHQGKPMVLVLTAASPRLGEPEPKVEA